MYKPRHSPKLGIIRKKVKNGRNYQGVPAWFLQQIEPVFLTSNSQGQCKEFLIVLTKSGWPFVTGSHWRQENCLFWIVQGLSVIIDSLGQDFKNQRNCKKLIFLHWSCTFGENVPKIACIFWSVTCVDPLCFASCSGNRGNQSFPDLSKPAISRKGFLGSRCIQLHEGLK